MKSKCQVCGKTPKLVYDFGDMPIVNFFPKVPDQARYAALTLVVCDECWTLQLGSSPKPADLYVEYHHRSGASGGNVQHLENVSTIVAQITNNRPFPNLLEIGCNDLTLLSNLSAKINGNLVGIDPAVNIRIDGETNIYRDFFNHDTANTIQSDHGKMDIILGLNVFAHVPSVVNMFEAVNGLLADDGTFIFEVAYAFDTILGGVFDTVYHEHFFNWTMTSINYALNRANLFAIKVERLNTQGGSLRVYVKKSAQNPDSSITQLLQDEAKAGVNDITIYRTLRDRIDVQLHQCFEELEAAAGTGEKIGIMGAPARGVTFFNALTRRYNDLKKINWVVGDDTPEKIGKYFPGTTTQVESLTEETLRECSSFLILAWTYEESIRARFKRLLKGKQVIVPFRAKGKRHG